MESVMAPIARAPRRYFIEFNGAMVLYVAAVILRAKYAGGIDDPVFKDLVIASPILPVLLAAWAVLRFYRGIDEYHRLQLLEGLAIAAGGGGVITICWTFLEDLGLPHLSIASAWPIIATVWGIAALYMGFRDKISEGAAGRTLRSVAVTLIYVAVGTGLYALIATWTGLSTHWPVLALVASVLFIARMGFFIFSKTRSC
jgi:hypothetical protein